MSFTRIDRGHQLYTEPSKYTICAALGVDDKLGQRPLHLTA